MAALARPASCAGVKVRIVRTGPVIANSWTFAQPAGTLSGGATLAGSALGIPAAATSIAFTATALNGDYLEFTSNGVCWTVQGASGVAAGIAVA